MIALRHATDAQVRAALSQARRAHSQHVDDVIRELPPYSSVDDIARAIGSMGRLSRPCTLLPEYSAAPVLPTDFPNLYGWWRADLGVTLSSGFVSALADQSGNGNHLTQGNAAARPQINTASANFNSRDTLFFDTGGYFGLRWLEKLSISISSPTTVYIVARSVSTNTGGYLLGTSNPPTDGARQDVFQSASKIGILTSSGTPISATTASTLIDTTRVVCAVFAGTGTSKIYIRSTSVPEASGVIGAFTLTALKLGMQGGQLDSWKGEIADVAIYTASHDGTTTIQKLMQGYHAPRYGLAVS